MNTFIKTSPNGRENAQHWRNTFIRNHVTGRERRQHLLKNILTETKKILSRKTLQNHIEMHNLPDEQPEIFAIISVSNR